MSIIRIQKNSNYSVISNVHLQDESLSWKAKGILSYLLSKPDDWQIYVAHLKNQSTDGRDATASGVRELIEAGYITRDYSRNEAGQITGRDYVVHETALENKPTEKPVNKDDNPKTENPSTVAPTLENPELLNTDSTKYGLKENTDDVPAPSDPESPDQEPEKKPSPSFSENDFIKTIAELMAMVPEAFRKPSVEHVVKEALKVNTPDYIRAAIAYTIANSTGGTLPKFKAYLGRAIDLAWAVGWEPETDQADPEARAAAFLESRRGMPDSILKSDAANGCRISEQVLAERRAGGAC